MTDAALFGLELRRARERRNLSLDQLADATKVSGTLFAGLERGDLARWPGGIFRRAFVRAYAQAVGLDPEETLTRFVRIYPEAEEAGAAPLAPAAAVTNESESGPRLVLDAAAAPRSTGAWLTARRVGAALLDLLLAGVPAVAISLAFGWRWFFPAAALVGVVGHLAALAFTGLTPGARLLLPRHVAVRRLVLDEDAQARRRADADAGATHRRRQPRHAAAAAGATPARPIPITRPRRLQ